jgi:CHAD domain-containing protein
MSAVSTYLRCQRDVLAERMPAARSGDGEAVHDARVAVRRLRATLRTYRPVLEAGRTEPLRAELSWLGDLLGAVRDADVLGARLNLFLAAEPRELVLGPVAARIRQHLAAATAQAQSDLGEGLGSHRYGQLMAGLDAAVTDPERPVSVDRPGSTLRQRACARRALRRADRLLTAAVARLSTCDDEAAGELHAARRAYKRARYAVEVLEPDAPPRAGRLVLRLKALQDLLGEHQDAVVAERVLREYGVAAHLNGENAFTYGLLLGRQRPAGRFAVPGLARAHRRAGRKRLRDWL